ncbi:hypothetical protein PMI04_006420 [Sphingobium sp. AP49]|uniref:hypothetical protein n=1 Tax=Sphingobium sp. AP49 TaxID=1144307 RepID=UPI00030D2F85|nr:hypothetical protein [Sphingobium sp. AP49]WHO41115.1 hypothetical protein PMI04_006420 [Sphingobium sp. AP49]
MEIQRKPLGRSAPGRDSGAGRVVTVGLPLPYEGVGKALRASFATQREGLPDDMLALLAKIDQH